MTVVLGLVSSFHPMFSYNLCLSHIGSNIMVLILTVMVLNISCSALYHNNFKVVYNFDDSGEDLSVSLLSNGIFASLLSDRLHEYPCFWLFQFEFDCCQFFTVINNYQYEEKSKQKVPFAVV